MSKFSEWAERHAKIFGFNESDYEMLLAWDGLFAAANYSPEDLTDATDWLALHAPPAWPRDHLKAIQDRIRSQRAALMQRNDEVDTWDCPDCFGAGRIEVPHLESVRGEEWLPRDVGTGPHYYTQACCCHCARGLKGFTAHPRGGDKVSMISFTQYQIRNPAWRRQMADRELEKREEAALTPVDPKWQSTVDRILASMKREQT